MIACHNAVMHRRCGRRASSSSSLSRWPYPGLTVSKTEEWVLMLVGHPRACLNGGGINILGNHRLPFYIPETQFMRTCYVSVRRFHRMKPWQSYCKVHVVVFVSICPASGLPSLSFQLICCTFAALGVSNASRGVFHAELANV